MSDSVGLGWKSIICIRYKFSGGISATDPGAHLEICCLLPSLLYCLLLSSSQFPLQGNRGPLVKEKAETRDRRCVIARKRDKYWMELPEEVVKKNFF